jgi:L-ascorbate metabolism protein UlaG (beta-lactamase superfamily)
MTAVPAADGLGSEQVSWIIKAGERRFFHGGDTLWHGYWDVIGLQHGPFDAAFLPVNGARLAREPASEIPAVMGPTQAVDAAILLRAKQLVPIHYGLDDPPHYVEVSQPLATTQAEGKRRGLSVQHLVPGEIFSF